MTIEEIEKEIEALLSTEDVRISTSNFVADELARLFKIKEELTWRK